MLRREKGLECALPNEPVTHQGLLAVDAAKTLKIWRRHPSFPVALIEPFDHGAIRGTVGK